MSGLMLTFQANPVHLAAAVGEKLATALLNPLGDVARPEPQPESMEQGVLALLANGPLAKAAIPMGLEQKRN